MLEKNCLCPTKQWYHTDDLSFLTGSNSIASSVSIETTDQATTFEPPLPYFVAPDCSDQFKIGLNCDISINPCYILEPCLNGGACVNDNTSYGYFCTCQPGFNGTECQFDTRACKPTTCWNNGTCTNSSDTDFLCSCVLGWEGIHCERLTNYCHNVTCLNKGICRPLFLNYTCECLSDSFSGRHCEQTSTKTKIYQKISKTCGYAAILALCSVATIIVMCDALKYIFHIDPAREDLERIQHQRIARQRQARKSRTTVRITYVHKTPHSAEQRISTIEESSV